MEALTNLLSNMAMPAAVICGILLIVFIVKVVADMSKAKATGKGATQSTGKLVGGVVIILLCIGLIMYIASDFASIQSTFSNIASSGVDTVTDVVTDVVVTDGNATE